MKQKLSLIFPVQLSKKIKSINMKTLKLILAAVCFACVFSSCADQEYILPVNQNIEKVNVKQDEEGTEPVRPGQM